MPRLEITALRDPADVDQVRAWLPGTEVERHEAGGRVALVARPVGHDQLVGYVQAVRDDQQPTTWNVTLTIAVSALETAVDIGATLIGQALDRVREQGGGKVKWWVSAVADLHDRIATAAHLEPARDLLQLRRPLPAREPFDLATRPFVVGQDEEAWLEVNNRAFHWHPEQGGWTLDTVLSREREPWFDAEGFLLHERDGRLAAFCWTKVHDDERPRLGEIYVIAVDPDFGGQGIGRAIVLAGLDNLHRRHRVDVGMLYVDASNSAGVKLYDKLGFTVHHTDRAFTADV